MRLVPLALVFAVVAVSSLLALGLAVRVLRTTPPPPVWVNDYDLSARPPEAIAPGTIIERTPPQGWSHLVIKSQPRVKPSEIDRLPTNPFVGREGLVRMVAWMFTVFTADVVKEQQGSHTRYRLRAIGLGLGTNRDGRDTVLTVETASQFGPELTIIEKQVLSTGYSVQNQARVVIHGPSFAILDTPVSFCCKDKNRMVRYRYGLLVDAVTGRLDVFAWRMGAEDGQCADLTRAVLLHPNTIDDAQLIPDVREFNLGVPNERAFGVDELPPHRLEVTIPEGIRGVAAKTKFTPDEARELEETLRKLLPN